MPLAIAKRHGLGDVRVFGPMARGDADETTDADLLMLLPSPKDWPQLRRVADGST